MNVTTEEQRKLLSIVCHGSSLLTSTVMSIAIPILILVLVDDEIVKENAKEAINFQLNILILFLVSALLMLVAVGFILIFIVLFASFLFPIIAVVRVSKYPNQVYRYGLKKYI